MNRQRQDSKGLKRDKGIINPSAKRLYDLKDAACYLGRSVYSVRCLIWKGALPCVKEDGARKQYLDINDMDLFIEHNKLMQG